MLVLKLSLGFLLLLIKETKASQINHRPQCILSNNRIHFFESSSKYQTTSLTLYTLDLEPWNPEFLSQNSWNKTTLYDTVSIKGAFEVAYDGDKEVIYQYDQKWRNKVIFFEYKNLKFNPLIFGPFVGSTPPKFSQTVQFLTNFNYLNLKIDYKLYFLFGKSDVHETTGAYVLNSTYSKWFPIPTELGFSYTAISVYQDILYVYADKVDSLHDKLFLLDINLNMWTSLPIVDSYLPELEQDYRTQYKNLVYFFNSGVKHNGTHTLLELDLPTLSWSNHSIKALTNNSMNLSGHMDEPCLVYFKDYLISAAPGFSTQVLDILEWTFIPQKLPYPTSNLTEFDKSEPKESISSKGSEEFRNLENNNRIYGDFGYDNQILPNYDDRGQSDFFRLDKEISQSSTFVFIYIGLAIFILLKGYLFFRDNLNCISSTNPVPSNDVSPLLGPVSSSDTFPLISSDPLKRPSPPLSPNLIPSSLSIFASTVGMKTLHLEDRSVTPNDAFSCDPMFQFGELLPEEAFSDTMIPYGYSDS